MAQHQPPPQVQQQQQHRQQSPIGNEIEDENVKHRTTTWIPILEYNKEQGQDGSYKTS